MKKMYVFNLAVIAFACLTGCDSEDKYVDLETGKTINVVKDSTSGYMINMETKEPVAIYVNTATHDTIYGRTGKVINTFVVKHPDGKYTYRPGGEIKVTDDDAKLKAEPDGDYKVKDGDYKKKVEEDGDMKIKDGDSKIKIEENGDKKVKTN